MHTRRTILALGLTIALGVPAGTALAADPGVTATEIKIGHTNPYSGPVSAYGTIEQEQLAKFDGERWVLFGELFDAGKK